MAQGLPADTGIPPASQLADDLAAAEERGYQRAIANLRNFSAVLKWWLDNRPEDYLDDMVVGALSRYLEQTAKAGQTATPTPLGADQ